MRVLIIAIIGNNKIIAMISEFAVLFHLYINGKVLLEDFGLDLDLLSRLCRDFGYSLEKDA